MEVTGRRKFRFHRWALMIENVSKTTVRVCPLLSTTVSKPWWCNSAATSRHIHDFHLATFTNGRKTKEAFCFNQVFYRNRNWQFLFCGRKARCAAGRIGALSAGRAASEDDFLFVFGVDFRLFARFPVFVSAAPTRRISAQRVTVAFYSSSVPRK